MNFFKVVLASAIGYIIAGVILLTLLIVTAVGIASSSSDQEELPSDAVLTLKLNYPMVDRVQDGNPLEIGRAHV